MDRPLNVFDIKLLFFSSEFNEETWWSCSTHRVLQQHQISLHSYEKNNSFISNKFNRSLGEGELGQSLYHYWIIYSCFFHFKSTSTMALQSLGSLSCRHHQLFNFGFRGRRRREHGKTGRVNGILIFPRVQQH